MNGWEAVLVMILAGFVLYLFTYMIDCFIKRLNVYKRSRIKW